MNGDEEMEQAYRIVLASASPRRRELLAQIGLRFAVCPGTREERADAAAPGELVKQLSAQKAAEVYERLNGAAEGLLVIGADTVVACDGMILGKPAGEEDACRMLALLQGRSHFVYTGVTALWQGGQPDGRPGRFSFYGRTRVDFYPMTAGEIAAYVGTGEPMDKAGAYGIQGRCAAFIRGIEGDYNNVVGLPVGRLYQELHQRKLV